VTLHAATPMWLLKWLKYLATRPYYCWWTMHTASKQLHRAPHYVFSSEKKTLRYHICSSRYAAVRINNCLKRTFVIKVATTDDFRNKWKPSCAYHKIDTFRTWWTKMNGTALESSWRMHYMYRSMAKGTSRAEATSKSEKIKPVA